MEGGFHAFNLSLKLKDYYLIFFLPKLKGPWFGYFKISINIMYFTLPFRLQKTLAIFSTIIVKYALN